VPISDIAEQMLDAYPRTFNVDRGKLVAAIDGAMHCVHACTQCADDCLSEQDVASLVRDGLPGAAAGDQLNAPTPSYLSVSPTSGLCRRSLRLRTPPGT